MTKAALAVAAAVCVLSGCSNQSSSQPAATKETASPQPVSGQSALFKMYQLARTWALDAQVLKLDSVHLTEVPEVPDKAAEWEATFVSPSLGSAKSYTWSAVDIEPNLHKGAFAGQEEPFRARMPTVRFSSPQSRSIPTPPWPRPRPRRWTTNGKIPESPSPTCSKRPIASPAPRGASSGANRPALPAFPCISTPPPAPTWRRCTKWDRPPGLSLSLSRSAAISTPQESPLWRSARGSPRRRAGSRSGPCQSP